MKVSESGMVPVVRELTPAPAMESAIRAFANEPGAVMFDSARRSGRLGRYSFLSALPFEQFQLDRVEYGADPFAAIRDRWATSWIWVRTRRPNWLPRSPVSPRSADLP